MKIMQTFIYNCTTKLSLILTKQFTQIVMQPIVSVEQIEPLFLRDFQSSCQ